MTLIVQGVKRLKCAEHVYDFRAGQYLVTSIATPLKCHFVEATSERPALGLCLLLRPSDVAEVMLQAGPGALPNSDDSPPPGVVFSDASDDLLTPRGSDDQRRVDRGDGPRRSNDKRVDEATGERKRFSSAILPPWARKSPKIGEVLPGA